MGPTLKPIEDKKALVVEDYSPTRNDIKQDLEEIGYEVDDFATPREAASKIANKIYQLSVIDISFDGNNIPGDEFVRKNKDILKKGKVVAFTANPNSISDRKLFDKVIIKAEPGNPLINYARDLANDLNIKRKIVTDINDDPKWKTAKENVLKSLYQIKDKDEPLIWYKARSFSANELIDEVNDKNSELGKSHIRMMFNWLNREEKR